MPTNDARERAVSHEASTSPESPTAPTLSVRNLTVRIRTSAGVVHAVNGISFDLFPGQTLGVVGESGSGKTVSMLAILGLIPEATVTGEAYLHGVDLLRLSPDGLRRIRGKRVGIVFQNPMTSLNPVFTIGKQISESIRVHEERRSNAGTRDRVIELLTLTRMPDPERQYRQYPHELSGGMAQRAMIAMAIANSPDVLIADEATTSLDVTVQKEILEVLRRSQMETGAAVIHITHDLGIVAETADRVAVFYAGRIVETGNVYSVFRQPKHPYTIGLLESLPTLETKGRMRAIPGQRPTLLELSTACAFRERCFLSRERALCGTETPSLRATGVEHEAACHFSEELEGSTSHGEGTQATATVRSTGPGESLSLLEVEGLVKDYPVRTGLSLKTTAHVRAVDGVDLTLREGETLGIVGESGSGKSTLGRLLLRLLEPTDGRVFLRGIDVMEMNAREMRGLRRTMQVVLQDPYASLNPRMTAAQILEEPLRIHRIGGRESRRARVNELMSVVGLGPQYLDRRPRNLSGGERQRISLARALALRPKILLLDEPTASLDVSIQAQVINLLQEIQERYGLSFIFISHNLSVVRQVADNVAVMRNGQIVEYGDAEEICLRPSHSYTQRLIAAVPVSHPDLRV
jgi:peptide/nickel transport system ATP-binding protein